MANYPTYPATSFEQAVDLAIFASNQLGDVINGDSTSEVDTQNGKIPSVRKALTDNFFFKSPIAWQQGSTETVFNQLRHFSNSILSGYYYAPKATTSNPINMGSSPATDSNWTLYSLQAEQVASDVFPFLLENATGTETTISPPYVFDSAIVTINGVVQIPNVAYTIQNSEIILNEPLGNDPVTGQANQFFAYLGKIKEDSTNYVDSNILASSVGASLVGELSSVSALRTTIATKTDQKIEVKGYYPGSNIGGGKFYYVTDSTTVDDGGTFLRVNTSGGWKRQYQDVNDLDVTHFGAIPDGKTDCTAAVLAMYKFGQAGSKSLRLGIKFPAGNFYMSTKINLTDKEYSHFRFVGPEVNFGYFPLTTITFGGDAGYAITVKARRTEIANLNLYAGTKDTAEAKGIGFLKNTVEGGSFTNVSSLYVESFGDAVFNLIDTLDTEFNQCYGQYLHGGFITGGWSNQSVGTWDHMTAVKLSNMNFHLCYKKPIVFLPRCTQSIINNVWMEQSEYALDLENGEWEITQLNLEGIQNPVDFTYAQMKINSIGLQGTSSITYNNPNKTRWLSQNEMGRATYGPRGAYLHGSMSYDYMTGNVQISNNTANSVWVNIGYFIVPRSNDNTVVRIMGAYGTAYGNSGTNDLGGNDFGGGELRLRCRKVPGNGNYHDVYAEVSGTCPVQDVQLYRQYPGWVQVYVRLYPNTGALNCFIETTGPSRYLAGTCFQWVKSFTTLSDTEKAAITTTPVRGQMAIGTPSAGFGVNSTNTIMLKGRTINDGLVLNINGVDRILPLSIFEKVPYLSDSFNRTGSINQSTADNAYGGNVTKLWSSPQGGANCDNGVLRLTANGASLTVIRTDLADSTVEFNLDSGPAVTTDQFYASYDFRKPDGSSGANCYRVQMFGKSGNVTKIRLLKLLNGTTSTLSTTTGTVTDGQTIKVVTLGNNIKVYVAGSLVWDINDSDLSANTVVGYATNTGNTGYTVSKFKVYQ